MSIPYFEWCIKKNDNIANEDKIYMKAWNQIVYLEFQLQTWNSK